MSDSLRDRVAAAIAVVAGVVGIVVYTFGSFDPGLTLTESHPFVTVATVRPNSVAAQSGMQPGMVVVRLNGVQLIELPRFIYPEGFPDGHDPETGEGVAPIGASP